MRRMALHDLVILPDAKAAHQVGRRWAKITAEIKKLVEDMFETMYDAPGIGLAAIQVGVAKRVVTMDLAKKEGEEASRASSSIRRSPGRRKRMSAYEEGCLSIPDIH